jgi:hypothetical protein
MTIIRYQFDYDTTRDPRNAAIDGNAQVDAIGAGAPWVSNLATMPGVVPDSVTGTTITPPATATVELAVTAHGGTTRMAVEAGTVLRVNADGTFTPVIT